jgi:hypothetical protein
MLDLMHLQNHDPAVSLKWHHAQLELLLLEKCNVMTE